MIKSHKLVLILQVIILVLFWCLFYYVNYHEDQQEISLTQLILLGISPISLLGVSILIQKIIHSILHADSLNNQSEKINSKDKFWSISFLVNFIFGLVTLVITGVCLALNFAIIIKHENHFLNSFSFFIATTIIASLIIAVLFKIKDSVHEINKFIGLLMVFISIMIFVSTFIINFSNIFLFESPRGFSVDNLETVVPSESTYIESEDEDFDSSESDYYKFNQMDFSNIETQECFNEYYKVLKYENSKTQDLLKLFYSRYLGLKKDQYFSELRNSITQGNYNDDFSDINYISKKLRKNPEKILEAFDCYKQLIYALLTDETYYDSNLNLIVDILILSHNDIYATTNPEESLKEIYKIMILGSKKEFPTYYYESILPYMSENVLKSIEINNELYKDRTQYQKQINAVWIYSFWARRYNEKNSDEVFDILQEIKANYDTE